MAQRTTPPDLPGFVYLDWLGGGGFADVFRYQDALGRKVAVKVLHGGGASAFDAEANLMAKLSSHPNIVSVFQAGVAADGRPFLVMEECGTAHLGARIAKRLLTASKAMEIAIQVAGAVETAHRMGILHRDIKPANILFTEFGRPALTDFGISEGAEVRAANNALSRLWAPQEQYPDSGLAMGPWSDVFSLAATTWAMLVGRSPLEEPGGANDRLSLRHRARTFTPRPTGRQDVPDLLERVLATALARDPGQRYPSALEFARALQGVQGQMNESVTPIDVLSDRLEEDLDDATELHDSGTRISGFMLIDPDQAADHTAVSTGPSSGVTSPFEHSDPQAAAPPPAQVALHGRGHAAPGVRDFTGPAVPELDGHTVVEGQGVVGPAAEPSPLTLQPDKGQPRGMMIGAVVGVAAVVVIAVAWSVAGRMPGDPAVGPTTAAQPQDPVILRVPPVEDLEGAVADGEATFTWTNPDPKDGDTYMYEQLSAADEQPVDFVDKPTVTVPAQPGRTCVAVSLRRSDGRVSSPVRGCVDE